MNFKTLIWIAATPLLFGCATRPSITKEQADEIFAATNKACDTRFDKNHDPMWGECFISMLTTLDPRTPLPLRVPTPKFECYELGLMPGTEPFSECVSREELTRAIHRKKYAQQNSGTSLSQRLLYMLSVPSTNVVGQDQKVYDPDECIGPVILGECKGTVLPNKAYHPTCHGQWLNGQCTGPMF